VAKNFLMSKVSSSYKNLHIDNIQEAIFNILRIRLKSDGSSGNKRLASFVSIMSELKSFHTNNMRTWENFLTFTQKIVPNRAHQPTSGIEAALHRTLNFTQYTDVCKPEYTSESEE